MCGVPVHAAEAYLAKLIRGGFRVAVVEQMEDPAEARRRGAKSVVRRELVRVMTPGTLTEDSLLDARGANRLAAVAVRAGQAAVATVELSTGEVEALVMDRASVGPTLASLRPSEILVADRLFADEVIAEALKTSPGSVQPMASALAEPKACEARVRRLYGVDTLDGFGQFAGAEIVALGLLASHLETTQAGRLPVLQPPRRGASAQTMAIDPATRAGLELERTQAGAREGSLLAAVDRTVTPAGARKLADRLARPLLDVRAIEARLDAVQHFTERVRLRTQVREALKAAGDMARAMSRLALGRGGPRDLGALRAGLGAGEAVCGLFTLGREALGGPPSEIAEALDALSLAGQPELSALLEMLRTGLAASCRSRPETAASLRRTSVLNSTRPVRSATTAAA